MDEAKKNAKRYLTNGLNLIKDGAELIIASRQLSDECRIPTEIRITFPEHPSTKLVDVDVIDQEEGHSK